MNIKFGDIKYFTLLNLRDKLLYYRDYKKLDLINLDKLIIEIELKIESINLKHKQNHELNNKPK